MRHLIDVLDLALKNWEDLGFLLENARGLHSGNSDVRSQLSTVRPLLYWRELRDHLMTANMRETAFDKDRFTGNRPSPTTFDYYEMLPYVLWNWMKSSRRVFEITEDLQALLRHTTVNDDLVLEDLRLPFDAFLMSFKVPLRGSIYKGKAPLKFRTMFVYSISAQESHDGREYIGYILFSEAWETYKPLGSFERDACRKLLRKPDRGKSSAKIYEALTKAEMGDVTEFVSFTPAGLLTLARADRRLWDENAILPEIARLTFGLSLYLTMLPPGSPHRSDWKAPPKPAKPDPKSIVEGAEICTVSSIHFLTLEERERLFGESVISNRELSAHFRRGHFRRAPGTAHDPDAPRVIMVRPTIVRRDRLQPGELVGGSKTILK